MQKEEQMRRRNPKAHTATILARKEKDLRSLQNKNTPLHIPTPTASVNPINSTQQVRWDTPMIATGEMLRLPSTAPHVTLGTESMLDASLITDQGETLSTNLDELRSGSLSSTSGIGEGTSIPAPKHTQSSLDVHQRLSGTPKLTAHDLQNHIDKSITTDADTQIARQEEALSKEVRKVLGKGSSGGSQTHNGRIPKELQKATRQEFQAIISKTCSPGLSHARGLQDFIVQKAKSEEEYRYLASEAKRLLEEESFNPKILLKVLSDISRLPKLDAPTNNVEGAQVQPNDTVNGPPGPIHGPTQTNSGATEHGPGHHENGSGSLNDIQENKGGRKRGAPADHEHPTKKVKATPVTEKIFVDLLRREAARSSRGGSAV